MINLDSKIVVSLLLVSSVFLSACTSQNITVDNTSPSSTPEVIPSLYSDSKKIDSFDTTQTEVDITTISDDQLLENLNTIGDINLDTDLDELEKTLN